MIIDIYRDRLLKYSLNNNEYQYVDNVWTFLEVFKKGYIFMIDYRKKVIKEIRKKYSIDEFYLYESILNKMIWNLRWLLFPLWINVDNYYKFIKDDYGKHKDIPYSLSLCSYDSFTDHIDLENKLQKHKIFETNYYRSFINKLVIVDKKDKKIITKPIEGSSEIFSKNYFNLLIWTIMFSKNLYEKVMKDPFSFFDKKNGNHMNVPEFYYQRDYPFPNINSCVHIFGSHEDRVERIKKMYYYKKKDEPKDKYWFRIIR
jgi:hypothetical protein